MKEEDFIRELTREAPQASLSTSDLQSLAKKASAMYLSQDTPLTDAVVKVASETRGITQEQVRRVVELTNTATFQNLFEKQASDKNVNFTIAEPDDVLRELDRAAGPPIVKVAADYSMSPAALTKEKRASLKELEADVALAEMFGVDLQIATSEVPNANHDVFPKSKLAMLMNPDKGNAVLGMLAQKEQVAKAQKKVIETLMEPPQVAKTPSPDQLGIQGMVPPEQQAMGSQQAQQQQANGAAAVSGGGGGAPAPAMPPTMKMASLKQKVAEAKITGKGELRSELESALSLAKIKLAAAKGSGYDHANPHGDLLRTKTKLEKIASSLDSAIAENDFRLGQAQVELNNTIVQHLFAGGNLGEVGHLLGGMGEEDHVKLAMEGFAPELDRRAGHKIDLVKQASASIAYEMENAGRARAVNPDHPIAAAFAGFVKLAEVKKTLAQSKLDLDPLVKEARELSIKALGMTRV